MTLLVIVLITATPLVFWFFRRRVKLRGDEKRSERRPTTSNNIGDKINTEVIGVGRSPDRPRLEQIEEEHGKDATGDSKRRQAAEIEAGDSAESQKELDALALQTAESHLRHEASGANLIASDPAVSNEQLPPTNSGHPTSSQTSLEHETPTADIGISGIRHQYSSEGPTVSAPTAPAAPAPPDNNLQTEHTVLEREVAQDSTQPAENELPQPNLVAKQAQPPQRAEVSADEDTERAPVRYRPPSQNAPRQATAERADQQAERAAPTEATREIRVRLRFDRFGFCEIGLLPERKSELDNEVEVRSSGICLQLVAQEDWYEDLQFENIGDRLRQGLELKGNLADHQRARWLLSGRDIYVLASHPRASYFVSTNRLVLGRTHVVLCVVELLQQVEAILKDAECQGYTRLDESHGVPSGWVGLRGVSPTKAIPLDLGSDKFYAIKPAPDIEIELEGGVCLRNSVWLAGYPPRIRLFGRPNGAEQVLIDGKQANRTAEGFLLVGGYDLPGQHSVYCEGLSCSCSYSIEEAPDSWQAWPAYHFAQADICGPLVQLTPEGTGRRIFSVPMSNPLLLGAEPGQIFQCSSRSVARWKGFVPFDVVWALPAQPLQCDKKTARILQFSDAAVAPYKRSRRPGLAWVNAILDASRKGLRIENGSPESAVRWKDYKIAARSIWRAAR
jgi:hypothetical protein